MERLARLAKKNCGVKLDAADTGFMDSLIPLIPDEIEWVILTSARTEQLQRQVGALKRTTRRALLEVTSLDEARAGKALGVDGLIAKGNESGGRVSEETTFILLQHLLADISLPIWAQGGIGLHTAAACYAAGAAGVVLDMQLALVRESTLPAGVQETIARMDGSETICLGDEKLGTYRMYYRPGLTSVEALRTLARPGSPTSPGENGPAGSLRQAVRDRVGWKLGEDQVWLVGQDAAFAAPFARQFHTVGGVFAAIRSRGIA
jgi:NAD(P)H-dependent flavin oxidoreductase YrpB (nitropropane dioxygenase family)